MNNRNTPEDFYKRVDKNGPNGCWSWLGSTNKLGYGQLGYQGRRMTAHRLSYELNKGEIPSGQIVRHTCDNPNCCNPDHLLLGTHQDNSNDKVSRGRARGPSGTPSINPVFKSVSERELERYGACPAGHTLAPNNQHTKKNGEVVCAACWAYNRYILRGRFNLEPLTDAENAVVEAACKAAMQLLGTLPAQMRERTSAAIGSSISKITSHEQSLIDD